MSELIRDVVAAPLGEVIASVGAGVADAQRALDEASLAAVLAIYSESGEEAIRLLQEIGYRPTFYALPETTGEVRVAMRLGNGATGTNAQGVRAIPTANPATSIVPARLGLNLLPAKLYATPVDAGYANQYGYSADISATLTFKIVPVPPPDGADELRAVPAVTTRTATATRAALSALGLNAVFVDAAGAPEDPDDDAIVSAQLPVAGTIARLGAEVRLTVPAL